MRDPLGDRIKLLYEKRETSRCVMPRLPVCVRLDGRSFSKFTKGLKRPYDHHLSELMLATTKYLVKDTKPLVGYTQSDEISLIYWTGDGADASEMMFGGKYQKLTSILAAKASVYFNRYIPHWLPSKVDLQPVFDCRVFEVPNPSEATNTLLWRWFDARRNSIQMAAQSVYSSKQLHGKNSLEQLQMLADKGIDWNEYPDFFKWGTFVDRQTIEREMTPEELAKIPEKHRPTGPVKRDVIAEMKMPPFNRVANRVDVIFNRAAPIIIEAN